MLVKHLIEELQKLNPESTVIVNIPEDEIRYGEFDIIAVDNVPQPTIRIGEE